MRRTRTIRFSMATAMMLVATAAAGSAFFTKVQRYTSSRRPHMKVDAPVLATLAIGLTAVALGALRGHRAAQVMLQMAVAYLGFVVLIGMAEARMERAILYWFQATFGLLVTIPLLARRAVTTRREPGPRRDWWRGTCEALVFSFVTMILVILGFFAQSLAPDVIRLYMAF
jgi:hypothetical protein